MSRWSEDGRRLDPPPVLAIAVVVGLMGTGVIALLVGGLARLGFDPAKEYPHAGSEVVAVADPSSTYTDGHAVLVADRLLTYEQLGTCLRARDAAGAERIKGGGSVFTLAPGNRLLVVRELGTVGDTFVARVLTGPHAGKEVFVNPPNVKLAE